MDWWKSPSPSALTGAVPSVFDERSIKKTIADRQGVWNKGDVDGYARLLTADVDISSATGRVARGRDAVVALFKKQREGVYRGASTLTTVTQIRFLCPDIAIVDANFENSGAIDPGSPVAGTFVFILAKVSSGAWLIAAIRGATRR